MNHKWWARTRHMYGRVSVVMSVKLTSTNSVGDGQSVRAVVSHQGRLIVTVTNMVSESWQRAHLFGIFTAIFEHSPHLGLKRIVFYNAQKVPFASFYCSVYTPPCTLSMNCHSSCSLWHLRRSIYPPHSSTGRAIPSSPTFLF